MHTYPRVHAVSWWEFSPQTFRLCLFDLHLISSCLHKMSLVWIAEVEEKDSFINSESEEGRIVATSLKTWHTVCSITGSLNISLFPLNISTWQVIISSLSSQQQSYWSSTVTAERQDSLYTSIHGPWCRQMWYRHGTQLDEMQWSLLTHCVQCISSKYSLCPHPIYLLWCLWWEGSVGGYLNLNNTKWNGWRW